MKHFAIGVLLRVVFLSLSVAGLIYAIFDKNQSLIWVLAILNLGLLYSLYNYAIQTNRKLARFFESVKYADFALKFRADNPLGNSFEDVNQQLNGVLEAFRQARAEKEANLHYINTIIQHVNVGLISFDNNGNIELANNAAYRLLGIYRLRNIAELTKNNHSRLYELLKEMPANGKALYDSSNEQQISISATSVSLRGRMIKLVSLQNIQAELQQKELDAWQNLTKVLRHEIMNSVTPIVSLTGTMREIIDHDLTGKDEIKETVGDLTEALQTIERRSKGIMNFVNAYREFTNIPKPKFSETTVKILISNITNLFQAQLKEKNIELKSIIKQDFDLLIDTELIEMVLINLVKNAVEALDGITNPVLKIRCYQIDNQKFIEISDNGMGIEPEAIEKIFIPFFTTKKTGSGIGLSLSRQIMQMHGGNLKVKSEVGKGSNFFVIF